MIALAKDRKPPDRHHLGHEKIRPLTRSCMFVVPNKREESNKCKALYRESVIIWQYRLWSFQKRNTKLEMFFAKSQL